VARSSTTWQKSIPSPNPGGRPKALLDLQELARQHTEDAVNTLAAIMNDEKAPMRLQRREPKPSPECGRASSN
jgi:hypothetical protein